jgi:hypothetical protein
MAFEAKGLLGMIYGHDNNWPAGLTYQVGGPIVQEIQSR